MQKAYEFDFVYDTQAAFRLLLEALSNPGRIVELGPLARKLGGAYAMPLTVAAVLLDNEVSFAVCGSPALAEKITELTLAKTAAVSKADYIFVTENADWQEAVQAAKCGCHFVHSGSAGRQAAADQRARDQGCPGNHYVPGTAGGFGET